jgi:hypothetical protein
VVPRCPDETGQKLGPQDDAPGTESTEQWDHSSIDAGLGTDSISSRRRARGDAVSHTWRATDPFGFWIRFQENYKPD